MGVAMAITDLVPVPADLNPGLSGARQSTMLSVLGNPRSDYSDECQEPTNRRIRDLIALRHVGPFRVRGLAPAVEALRAILSDIRDEQPDVHAGLGHVGMLCARHVRGSTTAISNHSWGTAIDLTLDQVLDRRGDDRVQQGLARIAPIFNRHRWFWGAAFRTEDAMHFEVSDELMRDWAAQGAFGAAQAQLPAPSLSLGDRGPEVQALQRRLNAHGESLGEDGVFGAATHMALVAFQAAHGLVADGVVGPRTKAALGLA
jgi:hypothetical protein